MKRKGKRKRIERKGKATKRDEIRKEKKIEKR